MSRSLAFFLLRALVFLLREESEEEEDEDEELEDRERPPLLRSPEPFCAEPLFEPLLPRREVPRRLGRGSLPLSRERSPLERGAPMARPQARTTNLVC